MKDAEIRLLEQLSNAFGPSGFESEPLKIVKEEVGQFADEIKIDKLGSLMYSIQGSAEKPKIVLPGHIDEVGFCVSGITDAFVKFIDIGGWFDQVLLSHRVRIRTRNGDVLGVIAAKPPHLLSPEERKKVVEMKDMCIDVGCTSNDEVEQLGIRIGDPIVPVSEFTLLHNNRVAMGKAFDDRLGACTALLACKKLKEEEITHPNLVIGSATTQEEVGTRGARTMAWISDPDIAIVCETAIAGDLPGMKDVNPPTKMSKGVAIYTFDRSMIPNQGLKKFVIETAETCEIPYQLTLSAAGGTDGGAIHVARGGCPSIVLGIPTRHIHSHTGTFSLSDLDGAVQLIIELVKRLDWETVQSFTEY
jgi:endoglucanase